MTGARPYLLVDDFVGQGGTLANLAGYIRSKGGTVIGATVLTGKPFSAKLAPDEQQIQALRQKHGCDIEGWWIERFGFDFERLTRSEARYLEKPRMLTPSEIELLRRDLASALKLLGQDEVDDAHSLMREHGFRPADFEILEKPDPVRPHISPLTGQVVVVRRTNEVAKVYEAGHGTTWLVQLETDLKTGAFGKSPAASRPQR